MIGVQPGRPHLIASSLGATRNSLQYSATSPVEKRPHWISVSSPSGVKQALANLTCCETGGVLVAAASRPPAQLMLREDLRTRLAWGLVYRVQGLSDEEKIDALSKSADARGMALSPGVLPYLLTHSRRDMQSLSAILDALDRYSLETQRPITMPLLRELLQLGNAQPTS